ncbi:MAG: hypothetical protein FWG69_02800 [Oscillospiraceae bacterium]|nr:hypothetical protein [Oscillospiraceae bacterium]
MTLLCGGFLKAQSGDFRETAGNKERIKFMLYPKKSEVLTKERFINPTSEYRGTPFWSWNCKLDSETVLEQIDMFKQMGFGGFHMHVRTGLDTEYLGDEFMEHIKLCNEKAKQEKMLAWLYDEDRWPSGAAGGIVTKNLKYRERFLLFSPVRRDEFEPDKKVFDEKINAGEKPKGYYLSLYKVELNNGYLTSYSRLTDSPGKPVSGIPDPGEDEIWYAYVELSGEGDWFNGQTYVNTLDKAAIDEFIRVTYDKYYEVLGKDFSGSVPAIFTDEPQFTRKRTLDRADERNAVIMPFTDDFPDTFKAEYGYDLMEKLPELFWELPEEYSQARYHYHDHVCDRFVQAFAKNVGGWCDEHNIALTGHMMEEPSLESQTACLGEAMRSYPHFKLPGIDMLCDRREFSTAKQAQSAANQYGYEGVLSELYGVTNWDFDFKAHKLQGDWQTALGVTIRVPHLSLMSMRGESKRDYPASIHYQSPWYKEYSLIENHYARLASVLTRGKCAVKVGVIHPVESYWLLWGPKQQTHDKREKAEHDFSNLLDWLLYGLIDFDFISESLLPDQTKGGNPLKVGKMEYDVIIVPPCLTLRKSTAKILCEFTAKGGDVLFLGNAPEMLDAVPDNGAQSLYNSGRQAYFDKVSVLNAMKKYRQVDIFDRSGVRTRHLIHQLREEVNGDKWLFICHVHRRQNDFEHGENIKIVVCGEYVPVLYNTVTGEITRAEYKHIGGNTEIERHFYAEDSLLFRLVKNNTVSIPETGAVPEEKNKNSGKTWISQSPDGFALCEKNTLLLDVAEYSLNGSEYSAPEEILRLDNHVREKLGYPLRRDRVLQPWVIEQKSIPTDILRLRYSIESEIACDGIELALEIQQGQKIQFNGTDVKVAPIGFFTDKFIQTVALPELVKGRNELVLEMPFGKKTDVEWCYLLGNFGVKVAGSKKTIIGFPEKLEYGDIVHQGMPFYGGSLVYSFTFVSDGKNRAELFIPRFCGPVLSVTVNGKHLGRIAFSPHNLDLGILEKGSHKIEVTLFGNRFNAFGCVHNSHSENRNCDPNSWRTDGSNFAYQYQLRPFGILQNPEIRII